MLRGDAEETSQLHYDQNGDGKRHSLRRHHAKGPSITETLHK
jgi:hypothetical protein